MFSVSFCSTESVFAAKTADGINSAASNKMEESLFFFIVPSRMSPALSASKTQKRRGRLRIGKPGSVSLNAPSTSSGLLGMTIIYLGWPLPDSSSSPPGNHSATKSAIKASADSSKNMDKFAALFGERGGPAVRLEWASRPVPLFDLAPRGDCPFHLRQNTDGTRLCCSNPLTFRRK